MNEVKLGHTIRVSFGTAASDGSAVNADSAPVVTVLDQGTPMGYSPTVNNEATGLYEAVIVCSGGNGFTEAHEYSAYVTSIVDLITGRDGLVSFSVISAPDVNVAQWLGTAPVTPTTAGVPRVDVKAMEANVVTAGAINADAITVAKIADNAITAAKIADAAIDRATFAQDAKDLFAELRRNTAAAGAAGTLTLDASASAVNDFYKNAIVCIVGGTGSGQFGQVSSYVGSTRVATMTANWATTPDNTSVFVMFPGTASVSGTVSANVTQWNGTNVATPTVAGIPKVEVSSFVAGAIVAAAFATDAIAAAAVKADAVTKIATGVWAAIGEGAHTYGDLVRLLVGVNAGRVLNFLTGTLVFKSLNAAKTRVTITTDNTGRLTSTVGDLT